MKAKRLFAMIFMFVFVFSTFSSPEVYAFGDETVSDGDDEESYPVQENENDNASDRVYMEQYVIDDFVNYTKAQIGKKKSDYGWTNDWCVYFVSHCLSNSKTGQYIGNVLYSFPNYMAAGLCHTKKVGIYYSFSTPHTNRLTDNTFQMVKGVDLVETDVSSFNVLPGDIVIFDWNGRGDSEHVFSHTAIVSSVNGSNVTYIDGNSESGQYTYVMEHTNKKTNSAIIGYIRLNTTANSGGTQPPQITGGSITNINLTAGTFTAQVDITTEAGLSKVEFPCWTEKADASGNAQDDLANPWPRGTITSLGNNRYSATYTANINEHNGELGLYHIHAYAFDNYGRSSNAHVLPDVNMDPSEASPMMLECRVADYDLEAGYYTALAKVQAEAGLKRVDFPTWTLKNGQDDLATVWPSGTVIAQEGDIYTVTYRVWIRDHGNERGLYRTAVYAYDIYDRYVISNTGNINMDLEEKETPVTTYNVLFDLNGKAGSAPNKQVIEEGGTAVRPEQDPVAEGYEFTGWYLDRECSRKYDFSTPVTENITLYAGWKAEGGEEAYSYELPVKGKINISEAILQQIPEGTLVSKYTVDDKKLASVNKIGTVTAKNPGKVEVSAYAKDGKSLSKIASVQINIVKPVFKFTNKDLTYSGAKLDAYDWISNLPEGAEIRWSTPAKKAAIATVDPETGIITAGTKSGTVKVTCEITTGGFTTKYSANLKVKIPKMVETLSIKDGKSKKLTLKNVSKYTEVKWTSSSNAIIISPTSKNGTVKLTALAELDKEAAGEVITVTAFVDGVKYNTYVTIRQ